MHSLFINENSVKWRRWRAQLHLFASNVTRMKSGDFLLVFWVVIIACVIKKRWRDDQQVTLHLVLCTTFTVLYKCCQILVKRHAHFRRPVILQHDAHTKLNRAGLFGINETIYIFSIMLLSLQQFFFTLGINGKKNESRRQQWHICLYIWEEKWIRSLVERESPGDFLSLLLCPRLPFNTATLESACGGGRGSVACRFDSTGAQYEEQVIIVFLVGQKRPVAAAWRDVTPLLGAGSTEESYLDLGVTYIPFFFAGDEESTTTKKANWVLLMAPLLSSWLSGPTPPLLVVHLLLLLLCRLII